MKYINYFVFGLALSMMVACSESDELGENNAASQGDAFMSLTIEMPNAGMNRTRAIDENGNKHEGTLGEQQISTLKLLVYKAADGSLEYEHQYAGTDLRPTAPMPGTDKTTLYTLTPFKITSGQKKVVVLVNAPENGKFGKKPALSLMRQPMTLTAQEVDAIASDNHFLMTNANKTANLNANGSSKPNSEISLPDGSYYQDGSVAVNVTGSKAAPTHVTIEVERAVAKIEDKTADYTKSVTKREGDKVHFEKVALINGNTKFYPIKMIREQGDLTNDYVVDPNFVNQTPATVNEFYSRDFKTAFANRNDKGVIAKDLVNGKGAFFYTLENTMMKDEQMNGYTTGLYYQATYQLKDKTKGSNVYLYDGKLFDYQGLVEYAGKVLDLKGISDDASQEVFENLGIKKYIGGRCYYAYWIRHINNNDATSMGAMEFAVVRNNYYQMEINSVKNIGDHRPVNPDPTTPDEIADSYLDVTVKVLPWIVRNNKIDF